MFRHHVWRTLSVRDVHDSDGDIQCVLLHHHPSAGRVVHSVLQKPPGCGSQHAEAVGHGRLRIRRFPLLSTSIYHQEWIHQLFSLWWFFLKSLFIQYQGDLAEIWFEHVIFKVDKNLFMVPNSVLYWARMLFSDSNTASLILSSFEISLVF